MTDLLLMIAFCVGVGAVIYGHAKWRGGMNKVNLKDWLAVAAIVAIAGIFAVINEARADELDLLAYTEVYAGIDYQLREQNPQCYAEGELQVDDRSTSHLGVVQSIFIYDNVDLAVVYTHHSCAVNNDYLIYDAIGLRITYTLNWSSL